MKSKASSIPFATDKILSLKEDLLSIRAFLKDIMELKNEHQEVKDLWKHAINASYHAVHAVESCLIVETPIWYDMLTLSIATEEIKVIKTRVQKITDLGKYKIRKLADEYHSGPLLPRQANTSRVEEVFVGFKAERLEIIDRLTRGTTRLDIISIVGMPGQGKTTFAKKLYNDPSIKYHFHKCAWCYVSQVYQIKQLLLDILSDVTGSDHQFSSPDVSEDNLAEQLWKSLKGRRFLVVMDDIWDIRAWDGIRRVLPDDGIGSRVVFTSRMHNLVSKANPDCNPYPIPLLNDKESWELLRERLFYNDVCPLELSEIGKKIASKCKGLPLAIVLVAGILSGKEKILDFWKEMIGTMGSHISTEGCNDLVELSYKHLPDCLKPCFLYFGVFGEDKIIRVHKLTRLWTAEGFVPRNDVKRLDEMAGEYLMDLIDRSLVMVAARSSNGEVKACHVHDVLYDFCLKKAREERFYHKFDASDVSGDSPRIYEQYRLSIDVCKWEQFIDSSPRGNYVHSLVVPSFGIRESKSVGHLDFFHGFKFLNVLDMEFICIKASFPEEITLMVHLRYLAIWCDELTSSIANLWNLETLIVRLRFNNPMPDAIWTMKTLRHVEIPTTMFFKYDNTDESWHHLPNVESFSRLQFSFEHINELSRRLPRLRKLKCELIAWSHSMDPITSTRFSCFSLLESLSVSSWLGPPLLSFELPKTLRKLNLQWFGLSVGAISGIGKLPNLQVLKLRDSEFLHERWDLEDGEFSNLVLLELSDVKLQHWNDCDRSFPNLEHLVLKYCDSLEEIPPSFGDITTLKRMDVIWSQKASISAKQILEQQRDMGNYDLQLYIRD